MLLILFARKIKENEKNLELLTREKKFSKKLRSELRFLDKISLENELFLLNEIRKRDLMIKKLRSKI